MQLFRETPISQFCTNLQRNIFDQIDAVSTDEISKTTADQLFQKFVGFATVVPIRILDIVQSRDTSGPQLKVSFHVTCTGSPALFTCHPTAMMQYPQCDYTANGDISELTYHFFPKTKDLMLEFNQELGILEEMIAEVNSAVSLIMGSFPVRIKARVDQRYQKEAVNTEILASIPYKLKRNPNPPTALTVAPMERIAKVNSSGRNVTLELEEYDFILSVMKSMSAVMERSPDAFATMREDHIRWLFVVSLNGHYRNRVTGETFNGAGKCDILIKAEAESKEVNIFVAECKIWDGEQALLDAIVQIMNYITLRDTKTCVVIFSRRVNFENVLKTIRETARNHNNCLREIRHDNTELRYEFFHTDNPDTTFLLSILPFMIAPRGTRKSRKQTVTE